MRIADLPRFKVLIPGTFDIAKFKLVAFVDAKAGPGNELSDMLTISPVNGIDLPECHCPLPSCIELVLQAGLDIAVTEVALIVYAPAHSTANVVGDAVVKIPAMTKANEKFSLSGTKSIAVGVGVLVTVNQQLDQIYEAVFRKFPTRFQCERIIHHSRIVIFFGLVLQSDTRTVSMSGATNKQENQPRILQL